MIKINMLEKINTISRVNILIEIFQSINSEIPFTSCTKISAVYQEVLDSQMRLAGITFWLVFAF